MQIGPSSYHIDGDDTNNYIDPWEKIDAVGNATCKLATG